VSQPVSIGRKGETELPPTWPEGFPPAFHVLAKPTGAICNLDCTYCFFLSKEQLYPGDRFRMSDDLVTTYLTQLIAAHLTREITIAFQGGEPTLMGVDFYRRLVAKAKEIAGPQRILEFTLQTNGTLLDDEWCEFLAAENVLVGLSLDGLPVMHDAYRVDKQGRPTYERVKAAWELLQRHNVATNVLCSVHAANADHGLEVYKHFRDDLGVRFIQLIPIVERATPELIVQADAGWGERASERPLYVQDGSLVTERSVTPEQWGNFLTAVFDEWVRNDVGEVFVPSFDAALAAWLGMQSSMCIFSETCGTAIALEHNGDVYSCDHYVEPEYLLGNISERHLAEMVASPQQQAFGAAKVTTLPSQCMNCEVRFACNGECPRNRFATTADGEDGLNYLCAGYYEFFTHIDKPMKVMAELLRTGRPADEVMKILAEAD
jgi:uncharacterized protein